MLIDLSRKIFHGMPVYPGDEKVALSQCRMLAKDYYNAYLWQTGLHAGTHVDAPLHLLSNGETVDQMPLDHFFAPGVLLKNGTDLPAEDIPEGAAVLIDLGLEDAYGTDAYYHSDSVVSPALCHYLISRKIVLLGVNGPSPDQPPFPVHKRLLEMGIPILENLVNLSRLEGKKFMLIALPLALTAEGSPVRAAAWIQEE